MSKSGYELVTKKQVKEKLHRILRYGTPHITYDQGCIGVEIDWEKIDAAIDGIPSLEDLELSSDPNFIEFMRRV